MAQKTVSRRWMKQRIRAANTLDDVRSITARNVLLQLKHDSQWFQDMEPEGVLNAEKETPSIHPRRQVDHPTSPSRRQSVRRRSL